MKKYLDLKPYGSNQQIRKDYYTSESVQHPAKMDISLTRWILENYCEDGDIVLDPMCGIATTLIEGMRMFPDCIFIGVEFEQKFVDMAQANIKKVQEIYERDLFKPKLGKAIVMRGDARSLEGIAEKIITSPPYAEALSGGGLLKQECFSKYVYSKKLHSTDKNNIGNLKYGKIDKIVSSPPYSEIPVGDYITGRKKFVEWLKNELSIKGYIEWKGKKYTEKEWRRMNWGRFDGRAVKGMPFFSKGYSKNKDNLGNLPHGDISKIITSPPYAHESTASKETKLEREGKFEMGHSKEIPYTDEDYRLKKGKDRGNIGKTKLFTRIPCPKEEAKFHDTRPERKGTQWEWTKEVKISVDRVISSPPYANPRETSQEYDDKYDLRRPKGVKWGREAYRGRYSEDKDNIGSMKGKSYLSEMLRVYQQCYNILVPDGLMILVIKSFIRNKKVVDLPIDTVKLCEMVGFKHIETHYRKIEHPSFWRILHKKKYPSVDPEERVNEEDILVFKKKGELF